MRRIRLTVEYDGTAYAGWQRQENALSVQELLEGAVARLTGERAPLIGASRTDAGVHALGQVAHFDTRSRIPGDKFSFALNTCLPRDIRVRDSREVSQDFHARFSSTGKLYSYDIHMAPHDSALFRDRRAHVIYPLDLSKMDAELRDLIGLHDFRAFAASGSCVKDTVRRIWRAEIAREGELVRLTVAGKGFLYNMVRIIAGTAIQVGAGKLEPGAIRRAIASGNRLDLGVTAPARGLTLVKVYYDGAEEGNL